MLDAFINGIMDTISEIVNNKRVYMNTKDQLMFKNMALSTVLTTLKLWGTVLLMKELNHDDTIVKMTIDATNTRKLMRNIFDMENLKFRFMDDIFIVVNPR